MNRFENTKTSVYVIDSNFKIVYSNNELNRLASDEKRYLYCYEVIGNERGQCKRCPLRKENQGKSIVFDCLHNEWVNVVAAPVEIPNVGACYVILADSIENSGKNFFYNIVGKSDYDELLELNYCDDSYSVVYHGERTGAEDNLRGTISCLLYTSRCV